VKKFHFCKKCGKKILKKGLGSHLLNNHSLTGKMYYDKYIKKDSGNGICLNCNKKTNFKGITKGYSMFCSRKCAQSNINTRIKQRNIKLGKEMPMLKGDKNPAKRKEIRKKISKAVSKRMIEWQAGYMMRKNVSPSKPQLELYEKIKKIYPVAELEYKFLNYSLDIAIPSKKIDIEYDGSYWHKNKKNKDRERDKILKSHGWSVIRIPGP
jgi:very-short-patch-repair endonuclease